MKKLYFYSHLLFCILSKVASRDAEYIIEHKKNLTLMHKKLEIVHIMTK